MTFIVHRPLSQRQLSLLTNAAAMMGMTIEVVVRPSAEEATKALAELAVTIKAAHLNKCEPFFLRESAWERRNRGAPFYHRFHHKPRHRKGLL